MPDHPTEAYIRKQIALAEDTVSVYPETSTAFCAKSLRAVPVLGRALLACMQERDDYKRFAPDWVRLTRPAISELDRRDDMIRELRTMLGMFEGAHPVTPQAVWEEALRAVREYVEFVRVVAKDFPAVFGRCWNAEARAFLADPPPAETEGTR